MYPKNVFKDFKTWGNIHWILIIAIAIFDGWFIWDLTGGIIAKGLGFAIALFVVFLIYMIMGRVFDGTDKQVLDLNSYKDNKDIVTLCALIIIGIIFGVILYKILDAGSLGVQIVAMLVADYFIFALAKTRWLNKSTGSKKTSKK